MQPKERFVDITPSQRHHWLIRANGSHLTPRRYAVLQSLPQEKLIIA
jgi:hypothetical protein